MKTPVLLALALLTGAAGTARAEQPGADWIPMDQAVRKLGEAGHGDVRSLKADDGRWEGKAVKDGKPVAVLIDPRSGAVTEKVKTNASRTKDEDHDD